MNVVQQVIGMFKTRVAATLRPSWAKDTPEYPDPNLEARVRQGYTKNEILFRCIQERMLSASAPHLRVQDKKTKAFLPEHPLQKLINQPNFRMSESDLWGVSMLYTDLSGKCYWEQVRSAAGNTVELWPLRPDRIKIIPDQYKLIKGYLYQIPDMEDQYIPAENVVEITTFDPLSLYTGVSRAQVAMRSVSVDNSETDYLRLFFQSGGMPPGLIKTKKKLIDTDVTDIRRRWRERYGGFANWIEPAVLDMDAEFQKTGLTFEEMGIDVLDARSEVRVCMTMNVPPILVGARVGLDRATYANYREARTAFWEDHIIPEYKHFADTFMRELADEEWGNINLVWDFTGVPVLYEKQLMLRKEHRSDFLAGGTLLDEYRQAIGFDPLPGTSGRIRVQSLAYQVIPEGELGVLNPGYNSPTGVGDTKRYNKLTKSPACRQKGETTNECVSRKIPEIMDENPGMSQDQAIAIAESICSKRCKKSEEKAALPAEKEREKVYSSAVGIAQESLDESFARLMEIATGKPKEKEEDDAE